MISENQPRFETDLAQTAKPEEFEGEKVETINNPSKSLNEGLTSLYKKHLSLIERQRDAGLINSQKADALINRLLNLIERDELRNEVGYTSREKAREIMGPDMFFSPEEVKKAGVAIKEDVPLIPFNPEELERAKELGQMLIYRTSTTMKELNDTIGPKLKADHKRVLVFDIDWYQDEDFYTSDEIQPGWALVSKELNPGSTHKNYLEQSELLAEYLVNEVYQGKPLPLEYQAAVDQFNDQKETIRQMNILDDAEYLNVGQILADLKINQLFRQSAAEVIYDFIVYIQNTGERLHGNDSVWTNSQDSDGSLIDIGGEDDGLGFYVNSYDFTNPSRDRGVSFCRRK